jgi:hypothetical protein
VINLKYPKINTLWKRDEKNKFNIIEGDFACEEFESIRFWEVTEKVDGTNIRVIYRKREWDLKVEEHSHIIEFKGRTDEAEIPNFLLNKLKEIFTYDLFEKQFPESKEVILYGEGYGNKIQSVGKKYRKDNSFILFDAYIDGWWLEQDKVKQLAIDLKIDCVPYFGIKNVGEIIDFVKKGFRSSIAQDNLNGEGIVARSHPLMLFRDGTPVMFKLKAKDYTKLKQGGKRASSHA